MFNKFKSAITGYKVKRISMNGIEIKTSYKGKLPSSDPLASLKELKIKLNQYPAADVVTLDFSECWFERLGYLEGIQPSSTAKFQISDSKFKIKRFVTKQNKAPLSLYTYSANEKVFALFSRVYDHGNLFVESENDLIDKYNLKKSESRTNLHYITNGNYSALVDKFGHSQFFLWNDQDKLNKCLEAIT